VHIIIFERKHFSQVLKSTFENYRTFSADTKCTF
jgi:hypothetical protein